MVSKSIFAAQIVRCITASISLFASSILSLMIITSEKGFKSPYSRIIYGLSQADILQSSMILLSPFLSPADNPDSIFRMGTVKSCEVLGFFGSIGGTAIPFYTLFLTYYFLRRIKYKVKPEQFARCEEKIFCTSIWIFSIGTNMVALATGQINATKHGSMCMIASRPYDCATNESKECTRGEHAKLHALVALVIPIVISFLCLFAVLGMFTCHVYSIEKLLVSRQTEASNEQKPLRFKKVGQNQLDTDREEILAKYKLNNTRETPILADASLGKSSEGCEEMDQKFNFIRPPTSLDDDKVASLGDDTQYNEAEDNESSESQKDSHFILSASLDDDNAASMNDDILQHNDSEDNKSVKSQRDSPQQETQPQGLKMTKEAGLQSILYILAFMLVYSAPLIGLFSRFSKKENSDASYWVTSLFLPIGGLLNMLIYTRPKVKALKKIIPELSIPYCFAIVIFFGGECPSLVDLQFSSSDEDYRNNVPDDNAHDNEGNNSMTEWMKRLGWYVSANDRNIDEEMLRVLKGGPIRREDDDEGIESQEIERVQSEEKSDQ
ncbi:hypothetical protein CTEN210_02781 [Chaetoceros tenuissimus]|uniref:G-protein coupled receptors family 1 profile domain-containing protein n=1 Tax=Chaetoceros tenuissimus TaxID=426638 RepID=A0AAD3H0N3_9STRA|nr:hypothetical protein CTEN210_02781 [Chaetoceros tenuissimus]